MKDFSSSTILFHHKTHHQDQAVLYKPSEISCSKCNRVVPVSGLHAHYSSCEKRLPKKLLVTISEEITDDQRVPCCFCKRKFTVDRIEKHQTACGNLSRKRPLFDVFQKHFPKMSSSQKKISSKKNSLNLNYPHSKWQKQHLELVRNLRYCADESSYDDYISCPHCNRKFSQMNAEKHIEICKNIINKPKGIAFSKLPSVSRLKQLSIRSDSSSCLNRPSTVYNKEGQKMEVYSFDDSKVKISNSSFSPKKSPLLKKDLIEYKKNKEKTVKCNKCSKKFLLSIADQHLAVCGLKPSATEKNLEKVENIGSKMHLVKKNKRANSTHRIGDLNINCRICAASNPKQAKFCMMCGNLVLNKD